MRYKLLALDMDGTLLNSKGELSERTVNAVRQAKENGAVVTISTGRSVPGAIGCARTLGLSSPIITYNGAVIADPVTGKMLFSAELSASDALKVMETGIRKGTTMCIWSKGRLYGLPLNERVLDYRRFAGVEPLPTKDIRFLAENGVTKVLWYDEVEKIGAFWSEMSKIPFESVSVCTSNPMFLEFFHGTVSKASALEWIAKMHGIRREEVVAVGDGANDLEMLAYAGLGVAMGNASDAVKKQADAVTASHDEGGVADVIERYFL